MSATDEPDYSEPSIEKSSFNVTDEDGWIAVMDVDQLENGEMTGVTALGHEIVIYRVEKAFYATSNLCSHAYALLSEGYLDGYMVECPLHGAIFDVRDGRWCEGHRCSNIEALPVRQSGTTVDVKLYQMGDQKK